MFNIFQAIRSLYRTPAARELKVRQLYESEVDLIEHQTNLEFYTATTKMLKERIERLRREIQE